MTDRWLAATLLLAAAPLGIPYEGLAAIPENPAPRFALVPAGQARVFLDRGPLSLYLEGDARLDLDSVFYNSVLAGLYWQPWDNLRVGAFYKRQSGARHNEDWVTNGTDWSWRDVNGRAENLLVLDASPRWIMPFLPGEKWTGEVKLRYLHNFFNSQYTLMVRPGLTYFWQEGGAPVLNFFLQYEAALALNYGRTPFAEHWVYLSAVRPLSRAVQLGVQVAYHVWNWSSTDSFTANTTPPSSFVASQSALNLGVVAILRFGE